MDFFTYNMTFCAIIIKNSRSDDIMDFENSKTKINLMRAFAGESMARNRYIFSADFSKKEHQHVLEYLFRFTAEQEQQHAWIFYNHLRELSGKTIVIDAGYPVNLHQNTAELLRAAQHNEYEEFDPVYPQFGRIAREEGFQNIASSFLKIAEIEKIHGDRFGKFAEFIEKNQLFASDVATKWICLNCGYVYDGFQAPKACPVCAHDQGYFIRLELCPFE